MKNKDNLNAVKNNSIPATFYFYDYETFGVSPAYDKPAQFAGIRTDADFNIIDEPLTLYCKPAPDYLPDPNAILITGITPQEAYRKGVLEAVFAQQIHHVFSQPNSCIIGYNNIRFDDEVTRYLFYRNFYDPYAYSWQNGNSRWDLLDVVRACYALKPDGIVWPDKEDGLPSFRLEHLTAANNIAHEQAHDAMSDVYATLAMAKLIKSKQPQLFTYFFQLRNKNKLAAMIDVLQLTPLVHISGMLGAYRGNTTWIVPLAWHPEQHNAVIVCDLMGDIQPLIDLEADELRNRLYTKKEALLDNAPPIPIKLIHTNKCPIIAPAKLLDPDNSKRLGVDRPRCLANLQLIKTHHIRIKQKINDMFTSSVNYQCENTDDVDGQLYAGFIDNHDRELCNMVINTPPHLLSSFRPTFRDARLKTLYIRYKARNYPHSLSDNEQKIWQHYQCDKFNEQTISDYLLNLESLLDKYQQVPQKFALLKSIYEYCQSLTA